MRKSRTWLQRHGSSLLLLVGVVLLANGIAGHLNGVHSALAPNGRYAGKIHLTPLWLLDFVAGLLIWVGLAMKRKRR